MTRLAPAAHEALAGQAVGQLDPRAAIGRAAGLQAADGLQDRAAVVAAGGGQHQAGTAGIDHDAHGVPRSQFLRQHAQRLLDQGQLVGVLHGAGDVDEEDQVAVGSLGGSHLLALQRHAQQPMPRRPGRRPQLHVHREGLRPVHRRRRVGVAEAVEQLFDAHGVRRRQLAHLRQVAPHVGVGRGVHVDAEGGQRFLLGGLEGVVGEGLVAFAAGGGGEARGGGVVVLVGSDAGGRNLERGRIPSGLPVFARLIVRGCHGGRYPIR